MGAVGEGWNLDRVGRSVALAAGCTFAVALAWRVGLVLAYPGNYAFDGLQRWSGREHVLVQSWLPALQALLVACDRLGLSLWQSRVVLSAVGALSLALASAVAARLGGPRAAWAFVPFALYGPHVAWTVVPYQEGVFLCLLGGAMLLASHQRWLLADLLIGLTGLVRYEGWPFVVVWCLWRRDPRALLALWGMVAWLGAKYSFHLVGYRASPIDIRDWEGMFTRFSPSIFLRDTGYNVERLWDSGAVFWILGTVVGASLVAPRWRRLLGVWLAIQVAITCAWMIALERSMSRMLVVPIWLFAPIGAVGFARLWAVTGGAAVEGGWARERVERLAARAGRKGMLGLAALLVAMMVYDGWWRVQREVGGMHRERAAVALMRRCPECTWWIEPRKQFGPRLRHDGCEVIQGISEFRHGTHFYCAEWVEGGEAESVRARCTSRVLWQEDRETYMVWKKWDHAADADNGEGDDAGGGRGGGTTSSP